MRRRHVRVWMLGLAGLLLASTSARADNWARFRGPNGTGTVSDSEVPVRWTASENVLWKTRIPGVGHSSPIVWGDRVFLHSSEAKGKERWLLCLDANSGKVLWQRAAPGSPDGLKGNRRSSLASSTPATDGQSVFVVFWDGQKVFMHAYDFAGKQLWERTLGGFESQHGWGASPIVRDGVIYLNYDQDGAAELLALDAKTGKDVWRTSRQAFRASYSTPFMWTDSEGKEQLVVGSTAGLTGYEPKTGKVIWNFRWTTWQGKPLRSVASPVVNGGIAFHSSGDGSGARHFIAVKLGGQGDITSSALVWEEPRTFPYVPCLLTRGQYIYSVNDKGSAACHEAKTGKEIWRQRLGSGVTASPVMINDNIFVIGEDGKTHVFKAEPEFKQIALNPLDEPVYASPAVSDGRLFIRGSEHLYCIGRQSAE